MKKLILIAALLCPGAALATNGTCSYPSNTSGCTNSYSGVTQGSTTPTAIANTNGTFSWTGPGGVVNSVTTASVDVVQGIPYCTGCYAAPASGAQSSGDITCFWPHEAFSNPTSYEFIWEEHQGGGSTGGTLTNDPWGTANLTTSSIFYVQKYLAAPNAAGGHGIVVCAFNYRLTNFGLIPSGPNLFTQQWQDAKCAAWFTLAQSTSVIPGNRNVVGIYGNSWGAWMAWVIAGTPDNLYTMSSCLASAPSTPPHYRLVSAWSPMVWMSPTGNNLWTNGNTQAQHAMQGQLNTTTESVGETVCASFTPSCDPSQNISNTYASTYANATMLFQWGTTDTTVPPNWGSGATQGGASLYGPVKAFAAIGLHPSFQSIPGGHQADIGTFGGNGTSCSQCDGFLFLLGISNGTSGTLGLGNL